MNALRHLPLSLVVSLTLVTLPARADGPADNIPGAVRRIPKPGITLAPQVRQELETALNDLRRGYERLQALDNPYFRELLPDVVMLHKAVIDALRHQEFFSDQDVERARDLLRLGKGRVTAILYNKADWPRQLGPVVRGYVSRIDGSVQPYGVVVPENYSPIGTGKFRLDVWFHGRGETLSEVNFLDQRRKSLGEFAPSDTIVLHPYGRYCNAFKFAGEVDVFEAIEAVRHHYRIDDDRVSVRGFSMGGAACWQFAVHYPGLWFAANPGAGFAETRRFLETFQRETLNPPWYEEKLWHLYDCTDYAANLAQCPTVAYSGELDAQKQAADVMAEALRKEGMDLVHVIGPKTRHAYHPSAKVEVERRMARLAEVGRERVPREVHFTTYTLKYNRSNWVTIDRLGEHWKKARVDAAIKPDGSVEVKTENVEALTLEFPSGYAPFPVGSPVRLTIDGEAVGSPRPRSDRSWSASAVRNGTWQPGPDGSEGLSKRHDLQGPIDDAFMDSFVVVRPTGKSPRAKFQAWADAEMARALEHWRRHFRGEARVVDDTKVSDADVASSNLVLWGDPESNALLKTLAGRLPIAWDAKSIRAGDRSFDSETHALTLIYPNPLNPGRYLVLNSGFTFRDYDYLNNARQTPKLPDWAVIDLRQAPDARSPGKVVAADFFDESWRRKPQRSSP
jgi:hypothetical protein